MSLLRALNISASAARIGALFISVLVAGCSKPMPTMQSPEIIALASRGNQILQAIDAYRQAHNGLPPPALEVLVPDYLAAVPEGSKFGPWRYIVDQSRPFFGIGCAASDPNRSERVNLESDLGGPLRLVRVDPS
jgi:hypothetical protein